MADKSVPHLYALKGGNAEDLAEINPVLARREPIVVFIGNATKIKVGDGERSYNELPFVGENPMYSSTAGLKIESIHIDESNQLVLKYLNQEEEKLGNVKGDTGPQGPQGEQGIQGQPGTDGVSVQDVTITDEYELVITLSNGNEFNVGNIRGVEGPQGPKGDTGPQGEQGIQGPKGDTGATGKQGIQGPSGKDGTSVEHSWIGTTLTITSASGTSSMDLKGQKGDKGDQGEQGPEGKQGNVGPKGDTGAQGPKGDTGEKGPQGDKGDKGDTGPQGIPGKDGVNGTNGSDGKDGASITIKSVQQSTNDGGDNTITFSDGSSITIKNGTKGSDGAQGKAYELTDADKQEIVQSVINALDTYNGEYEIT